MAKKKPETMTRNKPSRPELKFHFHNPNSPEATVKLLVNVFYDVQLPHAKKAIDEALEAMCEDSHAASENEENHHPD